MEPLADSETRVQVSLVRCEHPFPAPLTNERIGEILDEEDATPRAT